MSLPVPTRGQLAAQPALRINKLTTSTKAWWRITDRCSATGRAPDRFSTHEDRDARPVCCNGWLVGRPRRHEVADLGVHDNAERRVRRCLHQPL